MKEYDFTLRYRLGSPDENAETYLDALAAAGCDDALVGVGQNGCVAFNFIREAESAWQAIIGAIRDVQQAIPDAKLVEASPDFVGITDMAEFFGFSRQYMRKLIDHAGASFPEPVHEGKPSLWHLSDILTWFRGRESRPVPSEVLEIARINRQLNVYRSCVKASAVSYPGFRFEASTSDKVLQDTLGCAVRP